MQALYRLYKGKLFVPFTFLDKMNPCCQPTGTCWVWAAEFLKVKLILGN